ncbi:MAG TPA: AAA family ATPase, partial [Longimicrobiaceae bacterium]|nr:AAA family ATPase [Longimicrobiaceae bacterium]
MLLEYIRRRGFVFEPWQVAAYVAALRTKPFVILAGVTGTGKSRLPVLVAEGTGGVARVIPVRPDWTDSADVLGYTDLRGEFRPGALLDAAREAMGHPRRHWVAVLDEMNLARVEQYFAEVLSRVEDRRPHPRGGFATAPLLHPTLQAGEEWGRVVLPPNLALVGTVNVDESAHGFSRKVLDRAFTLELAEVDLAAWEPAGDAGEAEPAWWPVAAWHPRAVTLAGLGTLDDAERGRIRATVEALAGANAFLVPAGLQVGYRTRDEAALFVLHAAEVAPALATRAGEAVDPLDLALGMKLLPRVAGGSDAVRRAVLGLLGWSRGGRGALPEAEARAVVEEWERAGCPPALPGARFPRTAA